jgi:Protein of unknown function (DUF721).
MHERRKKVCSVSDGLSSTVLGTPEAAFELAIARLWRHWPEVLGAEIAAMIRPLGHRKETMLSARPTPWSCRNFPTLRRPSWTRPTRSWATVYFQKVQIELMAGRPALDESLLPPVPPRPEAPRPDILGNLLPCMDPSSP